MSFEVIQWLIVVVLLYGKGEGKGRMDGSQPDLMLILSDDQDVELFGMTPMTATRRLLTDEGVFFKNAFVTTPLCCPSRSSILTGKYVHNHGTRNNSVEGGCSSRSWQESEEPRTVASELQKAGYITFYAGKYLNHYGFNAVGGPKHVPEGWTWWNGLVGNSVYYNYTLSINGTREAHGHNPEDYLTEVIKEKALQFLQFVSVTYPDRPVFLVLCPPAPHSPFTAENKYLDRFATVKAPRTRNFDYPAYDKHWLLRNTPNPMSDSVVHTLDSYYRNRWRTLLSVDDLVAAVVEKVEETGRLNQTYFIYTSDNGFHSGQFSLPVDKRQLYEFDIRVPLIIRGPGVGRGEIREEPVLNIDMAPTLLDLGGVKQHASGEKGEITMDGRSLLPLLLRQKARDFDTNRKWAWRKHFLIEYWGEGNSGIPGQCPDLRNRGVAECHPACVCEDAFNNTYACVRQATPRKQSIYCEFQDGERFVEYYDLKKDPYQLKNTARRLSSHELTHLHVLLKKLKQCSGASCP